MKALTETFSLSREPVAWVTLALVVVNVIQAVQGGEDWTAYLEPLGYAIAGVLLRQVVTPEVKAVEREKVALYTEAPA